MTNCASHSVVLAGQILKAANPELLAAFIQANIWRIFEYSSKYSIFDALETQAHHNKSLNSSEKNIRQLSRKKKCQWMYIIIYIHAYIKYVINNTQINCFRNLQIEPNSDRNYKTFLIDLSPNGIVFAARWNGKFSYNLSSVWFNKKKKFIFVKVGL